jgi:hypothetical protein
VTATNKLLAEAARELAARSDGLQKRAAQTAYVALSTTGTVGSARNALADLWQKDVQAAALDLIGRLAAEMIEK